MYHITLSSYGDISFFQFHYFTPSFTLEKYQQYKREFLQFSEQNVKKRVGYRYRFIYVEVEEIPIDIQSEYKVIVYYKPTDVDNMPNDAVLTVIGDIPDDLKEKITSYRKQYISIYFSTEFTKVSAVDIYHGLLEKYHNVKIYKTDVGFHFYIPHKWETFEENLSVRKQYNDDNTRLKLDNIYIRSGVPYLINTSPSKWFIDYFDQRVPNKISEKKEASPKDITHTTMRGTGMYCIPLIEFDEVINGIRVMRSKEMDCVVYATADATVIKSASELDQFLTNFIENKYYNKYVDIDKLLRDTYSRLFKKYGAQIQWEKKSDNLLIIYVPEKEMGRVIGEDGKNVKKLEQMLGLRVKVMPAEKEAREREEKKSEIVSRIMSILRNINEEGEE